MRAPSRKAGAGQATKAHASGDVIAGEADVPRPRVWQGTPGNPRRLGLGGESCRACRGRESVSLSCWGASQRHWGLAAPGRRAGSPLPTDGPWRPMTPRRIPRLRWVITEADHVLVTWSDIF